MAGVVRGDRQGRRPEERQRDGHRCAFPTPQRQRDDHGDADLRDANKPRPREQRDALDDFVVGDRHLAFQRVVRHEEVGQQLGVRKIRLMTNNPSKYIGLHGYGLEIVGREPLTIEPGVHNARYLDTKRRKLGHLS